MIDLLSHDFIFYVNFPSELDTSQIINCKIYYEKYLIDSIFLCLDHQIDQIKLLEDEIQYCNYLLQVRKFYFRRNKDSYTQKRLNNFCCIILKNTSDSFQEIIIEKFRTKYLKEMFTSIKDHFNFPEILSLDSVTCAHTCYEFSKFFNARLDINYYDNIKPYFDYLADKENVYSLIAALCINYTLRYISKKVGNGHYTTIMTLKMIGQHCKYSVLQKICEEIETDVIHLSVIFFWNILEWDLADLSLVQFLDDFICFFINSQGQCFLLRRLSIAIETISEYNIACKIFTIFCKIQYKDVLSKKYEECINSTELVHIKLRVDVLLAVIEFTKLEIRVRQSFTSKNALNHFISIIKTFPYHQSYHVEYFNVVGVKLKEIMKTTLDYKINTVEMNETIINFANTYCSDAIISSLNVVIAGILEE